MPQQPPVKPSHIALICILAVAVIFAGSIAISVAVVQAGRAAPAAESQSR